MQTQENRTDARRPLRTRGILLFAGNQPIPVHTLDLSLNGFSLVSEITIPAKITGHLEINFPVGNGSFEKMQVNIQVIHSIFCNKEDGFKVGVLFIKPPERLIKVIQKLFK